MTRPYATGCNSHCNQGRDCDCHPRNCESAAHEGGNYYPDEPAPPRKTSTLKAVAMWVVYSGLALAGSWAIAFANTPDLPIF